MIEAPAQTKTIPLAEVFGPTIQGEGALAGRPTYFVRVGGCDYKCAWCDTGFAVNPDQVRKLERKSVEDIIVALALHTKDDGPIWLTLSGGNPAMYDLGALVKVWQARVHQELFLHGRVAVETQGSRWQPWLGEVDVLTISPKPPSSGMKNPGFDQFMHYAGDAWEDWWSRRETDFSTVDEKRHVLKCVVFDEKDYEWARSIHMRYPLVDFYLSTGTASGGLSGRWIAPPIPGLDPNLDVLEYDRFKIIREHPSMNWSPQTYLDTKDNLLRRYRWLVEKAAADPIMADVAIFPQLHALLWGITAKGV